jgi:hypothetical protein
MALAWAYMKYGAMPQVAGLLFGIKPVVVAFDRAGNLEFGTNRLEERMAERTDGCRDWFGGVGSFAAGGADRRGSVMGVDSRGDEIGAGQGGDRGLVGNGSSWHERGDWCPAGMFVFSESTSGAGGEWLGVVGGAARRSGGENRLAERCAVVGCHCREPSDAGAALYGGDLHRVSAGQMERCGTANRRDVLAGVCLRGSAAKFLPKLRKSAVALMAVVGWQFARAAIVNVPANPRNEGFLTPQTPFGNDRMRILRKGPTP